jgi:hypothetical protein
MTSALPSDRWASHRSFVHEPHSEPGVECSSTTLALDATHMPTLGTHETLYGWCGRFHFNLCSGSAVSTSRLIFGADHAGLLHDFPAYVSTLEQRTDGALGSARYLAVQRTLLSFFLPFVSAELGERIIERVLVASVPDLRMRLGITASGVGAYHPLRCCISCMEEDRAILGRPSWRIQHQAPAALVCFKHGIPLIQYWHPATPVHRREWVRPGAAGTPGFTEIQFPSVENLEIHRSFSSFSAALLGLAPGSLDQAKLSMVYRQWAQENACVTASGSIRHEKLERLLANSFELVAAPFKTLVPAAFNPNLAAIVSSLMRTNRKPAHALKHLILCFCMFRDASILLRRIAEAEQSLASTGSPRFSGFSDPKRQQVVSGAAQEAFIELVKSGKSARASAALVGISPSTGVRWCRVQAVEFAARPKSLKPPVLESVRSALRAGQDREAVAKANGISLSCIHRLLSSEPPLRQAWGLARHELARQQNRAALEACLSHFPGATIKQIRKTSGNGWMWLYRHDRDWLQSAVRTAKSAVLPRIFSP